MATIQAAHAIVEAAERQIRDLINEAVAEGNYALVANLAEIAERLRTAGQAVGNYQDPPVQVVVNRQQVAPDAGVSAPAAIEQLARTTKEYPRFEKQGDRLVKVGWSKKDRSEYEHRVEKDIASAVSRHLAETPKDKTFRMDEMLPVEIDGKDVPLYQAYLVLAWLRDRGLIGKQGKDGYQWLVRDFDDSAFEAAWGSTPSRR